MQSRKEVMMEVREKDLDIAHFHKPDTALTR